MLLAGGQGSRLYVLTSNIAKPAVPYRRKIPDHRFSAVQLRQLRHRDSGCADPVSAVGAQRLHRLRTALGPGPDGRRRPCAAPVPAQQGRDWYKGTANAIYQNIPFIERYNPEYVLVLSGDHIYKMDYSKMIPFHKEKNADCTVAVYEVEMSEASRFGILNTDEDGTIYEFEEKPKKPKSNLASMGIYVFTWEKLRQYLNADEKDPKCQNDFGKNVLPAMLDAGETMYAYRFEGYWKDVGTIDSLWEANMDLLDPKVPLDLADPEWRIYSRNPVLPPHYVAKGATIQNSLISEGGNVYGTVDFSVLFAGVSVEPGAVVRDSIIMPGARIEEGAQVQYAIVAEDSVVGAGAVVGQRPEDMDNTDDWGVAVIGPGYKLPAGSVVLPKAMIDAEEVEK